MATFAFNWPATWRLAGPQTPAEHSEFVEQVETAASLLLHLRDDALKRQLAEDAALIQWLRGLLLSLPSVHELFSAESSPLPRRTQELLLRVFLRIGKLQGQGQLLQHQQPLPCTACLDVCLSWETANSSLCADAAAALLTSLKPVKRKLLLGELRESLPAAIVSAANSLSALGRRCDFPVPLPAAADAAAASHVAASAWLEDAGSALQIVVEALATLRVATCCLPMSFASQLWEREAVEPIRSSFMAVQAPKADQAPFSSALRHAYAALARPPWFVRPASSASLLPPRLQQAAARARVLVCCCLVGAAAAQSHAVREELGRGDNRRPSRLLLQQAEELLQQWGASLLELFETSFAEGGSTDCLVSDLRASGACRLLEQWRSLEVSADLIDYIESIIAPRMADGDATAALAPPKSETPLERSGSTGWVLTPEDSATVAQLQEMLPEYGAGYLYLALREFRGSPNEVVSLFLENKAPASLRSVSTKATLKDAADFLEVEKRGRLATQELSPPKPDLERQILALAERAAEESLDCSDDSDSPLYLDDADEEFLVDAAAASRNAKQVSATGDESSSSESTESGAAGVGPSLRGDRRPVRGGTVAARRKEAHKASVGNHSRRSQRLRKVERCMGLSLPG